MQHVFVGKGPEGFDHTFVVVLFQYEQEVEVLKQQVADAQRRLQMAEKMLQEQESGTHQLVEDWQLRLEESEERMKKQQTDKDDQMKHIIKRFVCTVHGTPHTMLNVELVVSIYIWC